MDLGKGVLAIDIYVQLHIGAKQNDISGDVLINIALS